MINRAYHLLFVCCTAPCWLIAQTSVAPAGVGTAEDPYQIAKIGNLVWMDETVENSPGKHYRLMEDIDASALSCQWDYADVMDDPLGVGGFSSIGYGGDDGAFFGDFDGDGHAISGLRIGSGDGGGLFAVLGAGACVRSLALVDAYVYGDDAGGIAGQCNGGVISNCTFSGVVKGCSTAGGMVGCLTAGALVQCKTEGVLLGSPTRTVGGGTIGIVCGQTPTLVDGCCSVAQLKDFQTAGGLIGRNIWFPPTVTNCYWDAESSGCINSEGGEGRTTHEMTRVSTFMGLDFTNVWGIAEGASTPYLKTFPPPFALNVVTQGLGRIAIEPRKAVYEPGERVTLTAYSDSPGYVFSHWEGGESNDLTTVVAVTMTGPRTLLAVFLPATDISNVEELQTIGDMGGNYRLAQNIDASGTTNWSEGAGFVPLSGTFVGIFDGNGCEVRGLLINAARNAGLFRNIGDGCIIRRLVLAGGSVCGADLVGGLAGTASGAFVIEECDSSCDVCGTGGCATGGYVGESSSSSSVGRIVNCRMTGNVVDKFGGGRPTGGIAGCGLNLKLVNCCSMGNVVGWNAVGGLCGEGYSESDSLGWLRGCFSTGSVRGEFGVGGLYGSFSGAGLLRQSLSTGEVSARANFGALIGGGGREYSSNGDESFTQLGECYATGKIRGSDYFSAGTILGALGEEVFNPTVYANSDTLAVRLYERVGRTTSAMKKKATYVGWDFSNTWDIVEGVSYPYLRWAGSNFVLNAIAQGPGCVLASPSKKAYDPGEVVTLTAAPDAVTNMFVCWFGDVSDPNATVTTVTMDIHKTVTAVFVPARDISSVEELQLIGVDDAHPPSAAYRLTQDIDAAVTTNWNDGKGFIPICLSDFSLRRFSVLDGAGHVIHGLTIDQADTPQIGLIAAQDAFSSVRNLGLSACAIKGGDCVGGLMGGNYGGAVSRCFVDGVVDGGSKVGGIVGANLGEVRGCFATGVSRRGNTVGGIAGTCENGGSVRDCYAALRIEDGTEPIGGLVAVVDTDYGRAKISNSYWDAEASGCANSAGGDGLTTAEMMRQASFAGWDFSTEWGIDEGSRYPYLWLFSTTLPAALCADTATTNRPAYAAWAVLHADEWGGSDFSAVPAEDFVTAWLLDVCPGEGVSAAAGFDVSGFTVSDERLVVDVRLTALGSAKDGAVNGWVSIEGKALLGDAWRTVAGQRVGDAHIVFEDGCATLSFPRPSGCAFFRPVIRTSCGSGDAVLSQVTATCP